jgi:hypothetical protein
VDVIRTIKLRMMRWAGHVEMKNIYKIWWETPKGRDHSEDLGLDDTRKIGLEGVDWIQLAQDRDQ